MLKNPVVLVGVALVVAAAVWLLASRVGSQTDMKPLTPPPGESLRKQGVPPKPARADPKLALVRLAGAAALPPGDALLREQLQGALARSEDPTFKATVDVPFNDNAAQQVSDELREWLGRKMAGLGFGDTSGKPTLLLVVHIDPAGEGKYAIKLTVRAGGEPKLEQAFELPAAYKDDRMDAALAAAFAAPLVPRSAP